MAKRLDVHTVVFNAEPACIVVRKIRDARAQMIPVPFDEKVTSPIGPVPVQQKSAALKP